MSERNEKHASELSMEELDNVAGGAKGIIQPINGRPPPPPKGTLTAAQTATPTTPGH